MNKRLSITPAEGYTPHIGLLVASMREVRRKTVRVVKDLTPRQLDHLWDDRANTIGALLLHLASLEVAYQEHSFFGRNLLDDPVKAERWSTPLQLGEWARQEIKGRPVAYYLKVLAEVRSETLELLRQRDDAWLWQEGAHPWDDSHVTNNYFRWFHVLEDEVNHRGQIVWLKTRIPKT